MSAEQSLGQILADAMERKVEPRCPKCGGKLVVTISVYVDTHVDVTGWVNGPTRTQYRGDCPETKRAIAEQIDDNYAGVVIDERDEIYCEKRTANECDFWTTPVELEASTDISKGALR